MRKGIHPRVQQVVLVYRDGSTLELQSAVDTLALDRAQGSPVAAITGQDKYNPTGQRSKLFKLEQDPKSHRAWHPEGALEETGQVSRFRKKFQFQRKSAT